MEPNLLTDWFIEHLYQLLDDDPVLDPHDVTINPGMDGTLIVYWARKPGLFKRRRFRRLLRQTRRALRRQHKDLSNADFAYLGLGAWLD